LLREPPPAWRLVVNHWPAPSAALTVCSPNLSGDTGGAATGATGEQEWSDYITSDASDSGPDGDDAESGGEGEGPAELEPPAAPPDVIESPPGGVARRTRAHVSLADVDIEQLERFLTANALPARLASPASR
jgi:hypothetical protein